MTPLKAGPSIGFGPLDAETPNGAAAKALPSAAFCGCFSLSYYQHVRIRASSAHALPRMHGWPVGRDVQYSGRSLLCVLLFFFLLPQFFDVDTDVVTARLRRALTPHVATSSFLESLDGKPDLYGPFWVCATLVFVVGVTSNIATWMNQDASAVRAPCRVGVARGHVGRHAVHRPRLAWVCQPVDTVRLRDAGVHTRSGKAFVLSTPVPAHRTVPFVASVGHPRRAGRCECRERVVIGRGVGPVVTCCFRAPCSLRAC